MTEQNTQKGPATISVQQLSRLLEITPTRIRQLVNEGAIPRVGRDRYPLVGAVQGYIKWLDDDARRQAKVASAVRLAEQRAQVIEQKIAERMRGLIPAEDHREVLASLVRVVRTELERVPDQLPSHIREKARVEINRSLAVIAKAAATAQKSAELGKDFF